MAQYSENERDESLPEEEIDVRDVQEAPTEERGGEITEEAVGETVEKPASEKERVVYRWNYDEQVLHDERAQKKARRRGVIVFSSVMASAFLLCMVLLVTAILWSGGGGNWGAHDLSEIGTVAQAVKPSTVLIETVTMRGTGSGTGFFISENGYIATNYHLVEGAQTIRVTLYSGNSYMATLVGYHSLDDLAVLKIEGGGYPAMRIGNSDAVLLGDTVVVVGNPSGTAAAWSVTHGIISSEYRRSLVSDGESTGIRKMMQTDAPINPGNSGGPLCNLRGEVIGIVTSKVTGTTGDVLEGIGLALPINEAMLTLQAIINGETEGFVSSLTQVRPSIGIMVEEITEGSTYYVDGETFTAPCDGMLISSVSEGRGAEGVLLYGDLLYEMDGVAVTDADVLQVELFKKRIGQTVKVKVYRGNTSLELAVTLS